MAVFIHPTADVSARARLADGVRVWNQAQVREDAVVGEGTLIGKDSYLDAGVHVGARCKIQNGVYLYHGVTVEDGVFLGPRATTTNDLTPRAIFPDGRQRGPSDFRVTPTRICERSRRDPGLWDYHRQVRNGRGGCGGHKGCSGLWSFVRKSSTTRRGGLCLWGQAKRRSGAAQSLSRLWNHHRRGSARAPSAA